MMIKKLTRQLLAVGSMESVILPEAYGEGIDKI